MGPGGLTSMVGSGECLLGVAGQLLADPGGWWRVSVPAPRSVPAELAWAGSRKPLKLRGLRETTGVQSLHACPKGVQGLHALQTGVQALHACLARPARLLAMCTPIVGVHMACGMRGRACGGWHA